MWKNGRVQVLVATLCFIAVVTIGIVRGDDNRSTGNVALQVERANTASEARFRVVANSWRQHVADLRQLSRLQKVAADAAGFDEKVGQTFDLFETPGSRVDRVDRARVSLRKHVVDETKLAKSMAEAFTAYQKELLEATVTLYGNTGIGRAATEKAFPPAKFDPAPLERVFDPVVKKARDLSKADWFRFAAVNISADVVGDGIEQAARSAGIWQVEEGSVRDFFAGLLTQAIVEAAIDTVTDPTEQFAKQLQTSMVTAERELLDGPNGLITAMRNVTTLHQQSRLKHHGLVQKGGK